MRHCHEKRCHVVTCQRQVSRGLKRLVAREQNEVIKLLRELTSAFWKGNESAEASDGTNRRDKSSEGETEKIGGDDDDDETWSRGGEAIGIE